MINAEQIKGARAMLSWSAQKLANESGLGLATIQRMENRGTAKSTVENLEAVQNALSEYIEFIPKNGDGGVGMRMK